MALDWFVPPPPPVQPLPPVTLGAELFIFAPFNYHGLREFFVPPGPVFPIQHAIQTHLFVPRLPMPRGPTVNVAVARRLLSLWARGDEYEATRAPGIVTTRTVSQDGDWCRVAVTTNLTGRTYWHWYVNGRYAGMTRTVQHTFRVPPDGQINVTSKPVRYSRYSGRENAPNALSGEATVEWIRSTDANIAAYQAQYQAASGPWVTFAKVKDDGRWSYRVGTPQLDDDTLYNFRVVPVDAAGNLGTELDIGAERIVRYPVATDGVASWNESPTTFTFDDADALDLDWLPMTVYQPVLATPVMPIAPSVFYVYAP